MFRALIIFVLVIASAQAHAENLYQHLNGAYNFTRPTGCEYFSCPMGNGYDPTECIRGGNSFGGPGGSTGYGLAVNLKQNGTTLGPTGSCGTEYVCPPPKIWNEDLSNPQCITPPPSHCDFAAGQEYWSSDTNIDSSSNGDTVCAQSCNFNVARSFTLDPNGGAPTSHNTLVSTGAVCNTDTSPGSVAQGEKCFSSPGTSPITGQPVTITACASTTSQGTLSDGQIVNNTPDSIPVQTAQLQGCTKLSSGGAFCVTTFTDQPDTGVPSTPQTPDGKVTLTPGSTTAPNCVGNCSFNYYGSSSVAASTNYGSGGTSGGTCPTGETKGSDGTCSGSGNCPLGQVKNSGGICSSTGGTCGGTGQPSCTDCPSGQTKNSAGVCTASGGTCGGAGQPACTDCGGAGQKSCNSLSGGGDCTSPPTGQGDPIAAYIAVQQWKTACELGVPTTDAMKSAIDTGLGTTDKGGLLSKSGEVNVSNWFDSSAASGGGCLSDIPVNLPQMNANFSIPLSQTCRYITLLRGLLLIGAALASVKIVQGAF